MVQEWSGGPPEGPGGFVRPIQSSMRGRETHADVWKSHPEVREGL